MNTVIDEPYATSYSFTNLLGRSETGRRETHPDKTGSNNICKVSAPAIRMYALEGQW